MSPLVLAAGCFDPIHLGHIRHLQAARDNYGGPLYVAVSPDEECRLKGTNRPYFPAYERLLCVRALRCVDVAIEIGTSDAIKKFRPSYYVKGPECRNQPSDRLIEEIQAVRSYGGTVVYTDDSIYSSTQLMERVLRDLGI